MDSALWNANVIERILPAISNTNPKRDQVQEKTMVLASEGMKRTWQLRSDHRSPRYTTRLSDLPVVR